MANVRAFRSGNWSDTNPATSPWGTGGVLYAPAAGDDVFCGAFNVFIDINVTVNRITNFGASSRLWKDGATTSITGNGSFILDEGVTLTSNVNNYALGASPGGNSSASCVVLSGSNSASVVGNITGGTLANGIGINSTTSGSLRITGSVTGADFNAGGLYGVYHNGGGSVVITGNVSGATGSSRPDCQGVFNNTTGTVIVVGNVLATTSPGINNSSTGTAIVVGNVIATSATNAFVSANASAINKISGNIINNSNGTAAIYAARYRVDPVPTNSVIQYSNTNMFTTDSLSAFSMPPVSAVRSGVAYANSTLTGTCKVPSANSVNIGVPVDNTVGTAFLTPATLFDASVASLTASDSLGARLKNSATVQSVGNIIASFSN